MDVIIMSFTQVIIKKTMKTFRNNNINRKKIVFNRPDENNEKFSNVNEKKKAKHPRASSRSKGIAARHKNRVFDRTSPENGNYCVRKCDKSHMNVHIRSFFMCKCIRLYSYNSYVHIIHVKLQWNDWKWEEGKI